MGLFEPVVDMKMLPGASKMSTDLDWAAECLMVARAALVEAYKLVLHRDFLTKIECDTPRRADD